MSSNDGHPTGPDAQDKYEAAVLDFLEKEMAAGQPAQEASQQSNELDALVSDLLKQVITEADQPQDGNKLLFDAEDELFAGLTSEQKKAPFAVSPIPDTSLELPPAAVVPTEPVVSEPAVDIAAEPESAVAKPELPPKKRPARAFAGLLLESALAARSKLPVRAIACAAAVALIAGAIYFFSGSSSKAPQNPAPQAAVTQPAETQAVPAAQTTVVTTSATPNVTPTAVQPLPAPAAKKPPSKTTPPVAAVVPATASVQQPAPATPTGSAVPAKEEKPAEAQPETPPVQPPVAAATEKPVLKPTADNASSATPAVTEKNPPKPAEPQIAENSAPAPKPAAAGPIARNLIAAVPISQVSPVYPELALRSRTSASIVLELQIDEQGKVSKATPVSGPVMFHSAAVAAVLKWRYKPASIGGLNVPSRATVTMVFNLKK